MILCRENPDNYIYHVLLISDLAIHAPISTRKVDYRKAGLRRERGELGGLLRDGGDGAAGKERERKDETGQEEGRLEDRKVKPCHYFLAIFGFKVVEDRNVLITFIGNPEGFSYYGQGVYQLHQCSKVLRNRECD